MEIQSSGKNDYVIVGSSIRLQLVDKHDISENVIIKYATITASLSKCFGAEPCSLKLLQKRQCLDTICMRRTPAKYTF